MAFASDSTTAPARPLLPRRDARGRFVKLAPDPRPELPPEPLLSGGIVPSEDTPVGVLSSEQTPMGALTFEETSVGVSRFGDTPDAVDAAAQAYHARTLHLRRQLAEAAEHGAALLATLGLPRLVGPDTIIVDPVAAGDALDLAIATLDALDGDTDVEDGGDDEPSLAWVDGQSEHCIDYQDRELDTADAEPSLASPERHPRVPDFAWGPIYAARGGEEGQLRWAEGAQHDGEAVNEDGDDLDAGEHDTADHESYLGWPEDVGAVMSAETAVLTADPDAEHDDSDAESTAPERYGKGFVCCGPDDAEDSDPAERDDEHGSEDGEDIGHHASQHLPRPLSPATRAEIAVMAARVAKVRRAPHV